MTWTDRFWTAYRVVTNIAIDATANTLNILGSAACIAGGALFNVSFAMDDSMNGSYYGGIDAIGNVNVNLYAVELKYTYNQTLPIDESYATKGSQDFNLKNYIQPDSIRIISAICMASGFLFRTVSANIDLWQQGRRDAHDYKNRHGIDLPKPSGKEFITTNAQSISGSLSYMMLSSSTAGGLLNFLQILNHKNVTYPAHSKVIPFNLDLIQNATINIPSIGMTVHVLEHIFAMIQANATYGGRVELQLNNLDIPPVAVTAPLGSAAYLANRFFTQQARSLRDERAYEAQKDAYSPINHA